MIYGVLVSYNSVISESSTYKSLKPVLSQISLVVIDNSINRHIQESNLFFCRKHKLPYFYMNGNKGLSRAYNCALEYILSIDKTADSIVVWLDDDTNIPPTYFEELIKSVDEKKEVDIFTPIVVGQDGIIWSPNYAGFIRNKLVKTTYEVIPDNKYNAINSCTAVRLRVYENYRYDERLFLDQVDHKFFYDQRRREKKFLTLSSEVKQNFSQRQEQNNSKQIYERVKIRFKDIIIYGSLQKKKFYVLMAYIKCVGLSIALGKNLGSITFIIKALWLSTQYLYLLLKGKL